MFHVVYVFVYCTADGKNQNISCLVWVGLWIMIVANDVIYQKIVTPVWVAMLILTFVYFIFCVQKSLLFDEKILEDYTYEIRI